MKKIRIETALVLAALAVMLGIHLGTMISTSAYRQVVLEQQSQSGAMDAREIKSLKLFARILWGESSLRPCVSGDHDKQFISFGPAQYQERTFNEFKQEARLPWLEWRNPEHQIILTWWAVKHGKEQAWTVVNEQEL